jgi:tetratricopeptide (TPR) repeat protein
VAYGNRADAWAAKAEYDLAIADYNEVIRLQPREQKAFIGRGKVWLSKGEDQLADADFNEAIRIDPKSGHAYSGLACVWATSADPRYRDGPKAVEYALKGCELDGWTTSEFVKILGMAYAEVGNFAEAKKWQRHAIGLETDEAERTELIKGLKLYDQGKKPYSRALIQ